MTVSEAIMAADELRPNAFSDDVKTSWLAELDGKIILEVFNNDVEGFAPYTYPKDANMELLVKFPHSEIYPMYIVAMVDFYNNDVEQYQNSMSMFNNRYDIFAKWYQRENMPKSCGSGFKNLF